MRRLWDKEHIVKLHSCTVIAWSTRLKETELEDWPVLSECTGPDPEKLAGFLPFDSEKAASQLQLTPSPTENKIKSIAHKNSLYFCSAFHLLSSKGNEGINSGYTPQ